MNIYLEISIEDYQMNLSLNFKNIFTFYHYLIFFDNKAK